MRNIKTLLPNIVLLEVVLFSVLFILVGYIFKSEDPLFMKTPFSPTVLLSLVFSLYYGFAGGLSFFGILLVASFLLYKDIPITSLLWNLLVVLIASEFRYYWARRIRSAELEKEYLQEQISRLRKELFMLKLSHDQLEFNYIVKPYSLRRMIADLREKLLKEQREEMIVKYFLNVLSQSFQIYRASIYKYSDGEFKFVASIGGTEEKIDEEDQLLRLAVESQESYFLPPKALRRIHLNGRGFKYLAVVYASLEEETYVLTIEDMIFVNLNEETLAHIHILLLYMLEDIVFSRKVARFYDRERQECPFEFVREFYKMYELHKKVGVESSLVVFRFKDLTPDIEHELEHTARSLDMVCFLRDRNLVVFLLPFTAYVNAQSFANRILNKFKDAELVAIREIKSPTVEKTLEGIGV
ncbi:MAG: hypothetical protein GXO18_07540 [Aquificae bacterium]|nr:hypothetical protein [Aquificota bacterium]